MKLRLSESFLLWVETALNPILRKLPFVKKELKFRINEKRFDELRPTIHKLGSAMGVGEAQYDQLERSLKEYGLAALVVIPRLYRKTEGLEPIMQDLFKEIGVVRKPSNQRYLRGFVWFDERNEGRGKIEVIDEYMNQIEQNQEAYQQIRRLLSIQDRHEEIIDNLRRAMFYWQLSDIDAVSQTILRMAKAGTVSRSGFTDEALERTIDRVLDRINKTRELQAKGSIDFTTKQKTNRVKTASPKPDRNWFRVQVSQSSVAQAFNPAEKGPATIIEERIREIEHWISQETKEVSRSEEQITLVKLSYEENEKTKEKLLGEIEELSSENAELRDIAAEHEMDITALPPIEKSLAQKEYNAPKKQYAEPNIPHPLSEDVLAHANEIIRKKNDLLIEKRKVLVDTLQSHHQLLLDLETWENKNARAEKDISILGTQKEAFEAQNAELESLIHNSGPDLQSVYPPLSQIKEWVEQTIPEGHIIILDRAFKSAAASSYARPALVFKSIELLAGEYRDQMLSGTLPEDARREKRNKFNELRTELGLSIGGSMTANTGHHKEAYMRTLDDQRFYLDQHLGRGNSRDPRYCLRIYFTWNPERKAVVIGHMPDHLPNQLS